MPTTPATPRGKAYQSVKLGTLVPRLPPAKLMYTISKQCGFERRSMVDDSSRRRVLLACGAVSTAIAGCLSGDDSPDLPAPDGDDSDSPTDDNTENGGEDTNEADNPASEESQQPENVTWPAIEAGELLSDFSEDAPVEALRGEFFGDPDEARVGDQALVIESEQDRAGVSLFFPDGLDLTDWNTSMAVKAEAISRIAIEYRTPSGQLTSLRRLPNDHDDWLRVDFGYDDKQDEPDVTNITELRILGLAHDDGPTRFAIDDLRRTESLQNGKAILVCYGADLSHYDIAAEMLQARGWPAAVAVAPRRIGGSGRMDAHDLRELQGDGWDICPAPRGPDGLSGLPKDEQETIIREAKELFTARGFEDGARHFFAPDWREFDPTNHELVREHHETGFVFGSGPCGLPPTARDLIPMVWGPALHGGVRRYINLADQYGQLVVLRIPRIVEAEEDVDSNSMWVEDFAHLLDHLDHRGLDVITPSDIVDGTLEDDRDREESRDRPEGIILEGGEAHTFDGDGGGNTDSFDLDDGVLFAEIAHDGDGDFIAEIIPVEGDVPNNVLANSAGMFEGESVIAIAEGTYELAVVADGSWSIDVSQPEVYSDDIVDLPYEATGTGTSFIGPLWTEGDGRVSATHDGSGDFTLDLYGADGSWEQVISQSGSFDGSRSYRGVGAGWFNVEATGEWTIEIQ